MCAYISLSLYIYIYVSPNETKTNNNNDNDNSVQRRQAAARFLGVGARSRFSALRTKLGHYQPQGNLLTEL